MHYRKLQESLKASEISLDTSQVFHPIKIYGRMRSKSLTGANGKVGAEEHRPNEGFYSKNFEV